jgi:hypothetical protein
MYLDDCVLGVDSYLFRDIPESDTVPDFSTLTPSDYWISDTIDWDASNFQFPEVIGTNFAIVYEGAFDHALCTWLHMGIESSGGS